MNAVEQATKEYLAILRVEQEKTQRLIEAVEGTLKPKTKKDCESRVFGAQKRNSPEKPTSQPKKKTIRTRRTRKVGKKRKVVKNFQAGELRKATLDVLSSFPSSVTPKDVTVRLMERLPEKFVGRSTDNAVATIQATLNRLSRDEKVPGLVRDDSQKPVRYAYTVKRRKPWQR